MSGIWEVFVVLSVLGSAATGLWFAYQRATGIKRLLHGFVTPDITDGIFGESAGITTVDDERFEHLIKSHAATASHTIDRISVHMYTIDKLEHSQFRNPTVRHRILLLKPTQEGETGDNTGYETSMSSQHIDADFLEQDTFAQPFGYIYQSLTSREWQNVRVKVYETTPWIRGALIDNRVAGILFLPTLQSGRQAEKFWTENPETVCTFTDIFEDIWTDERTTEFISWYEQWDASQTATAEPQSESLSSSN